MISRRELLAGALLAGPALRAARTGARTAGHTAAYRGPDAREPFAALERLHGGRLGVAVLDTATGHARGYREDERFPLCSTFKLLAAACVLARVDRQRERLTRRVVYGHDAIVPNSPTTEEHAGGEGLTVGALCEAAVTLSDNTAGNLLLDSFGGPAALTGYLRTLGDPVTRLDRREPAMNVTRPGDPRDTTTPRAMLGLVRATVLGTALSSASREQLTAWMVATTTGGRRLRAGVPDGWRVGDKTGTGPDPRHATNDVAVIWPPRRAPIVVTAYYVDGPAPDDVRDAVLAEVGRLATAG
ncbi:beta-lactamase [Gemmatimonadetes bacterium T265]|nr:beta-lactamase [Gemmatimonadetes bacterium T265]